MNQFCNNYLTLSDLDFFTKILMTNPTATTTSTMIHTCLPNGALENG